MTCPGLDLSHLLGREIPGGCDLCDAFHTVAEDEEMPGVWVLTVHHDDDCLALRARTGRKGRN